VHVMSDDGSRPAPAASPSFIFHISPLTTSTLLFHPMTDKPVSKRQRFSQYEPAQDNFLTFQSTPDAEGHAAFGFDSIDPFLSPATSWGFDEFAHDPNYLASQEELRSLLFTTARSAAPTRAGTPTSEDHEHDSGEASFNIKQVLVKGKRIQYLKNYISQVAPWVPCPVN
jgi:hypothetical protein